MSYLNTWLISDYLSDELPALNAVYLNTRLPSMNNTFNTWLPDYLPDLYLNTRLPAWAIPEYLTQLYLNTGLPAWTIPEYRTTWLNYTWIPDYLPELNTWITAMRTSLGTGGWSVDSWPTNSRNMEGEGDVKWNNFFTSY